MVKYSTQIPSKKKNAFVNPSKLLLIAEIAVLSLIIIAAVMYAALQKINNDTALTAPPASSRVGMLVVEYDFSSGKAIKRTDPLTKSLRTFLEKDVDSLGCTSIQSGYETIVASSNDRRQLLVSYGCDTPNSPAYVVYTHNAWKFLSPTNQFSNLGFPACEYVSTNAISMTIAPVCVDSVSSLKPQYTVRS